jgi:hypothetical protein
MNFHEIAGIYAFSLSIVTVAVCFAVAYHARLGRK